MSGDPRGGCERWRAAPQVRSTRPDGHGSMPASQSRRLGVTRSCNYHPWPASKCPRGSAATNHKLAFRGTDMKRIFLAAGLALAANATAAQEVTLKAITAFAENTTYSRPFERFITRVNQDGKGLVQINYIGSPKAIQSFEVVNAIQVAAGYT